MATGSAVEAGKRETSFDDDFFDAEAESIFLEIQQGKHGAYNDLDAIWKDKKTGGEVYVGNLTAAKNINLLRSHGISRVVNCRGTSDVLDSDGIKYFSFPIVQAKNQTFCDCNSVWLFFVDFFTFIEKGLQSGGSVLIHCIAGAHRAPTAAACYLLYKTRKDALSVHFHLKTCRPIIDIGLLCDINQFLPRIEEALKEKKFPAL